MRKRFLRYLFSYLNRTSRSSDKNDTSLRALSPSSLIIHVFIASKIGSLNVCRNVCRMSFNFTRSYKVFPIFVSCFLRISRFELEFNSYIRLSHNNFNFAQKFTIPKKLNALFKSTIPLNTKHSAKQQHIIQGKEARAHIAAKRTEQRRNIKSKEF